MSNCEIKESSLGRMVVYLFAFISIVLMMVRLGDGTFWGDECHAIIAARNSFKQIIIDQSWDAHPPLYFLILSAFCKVFGFSGKVYRFVSALPMIITVCFGAVSIRREFGNIVATFFIYLITFMKGCLIYSVEVRMYSWSFLFILLMSYYAYVFCKAEGMEKNKNQILMILYALCAAYTNMFAFLSACGVYLAVFVWMGLSKTFDIKRIFIIILSSLILYSPWIWVNIRLYTQTVTGTPWIDKDYSFIEALRYAFNGVGGIVIILILLTGIIISIIKKDYYISLNCLPFVFLYIFCIAYSKMTSPFIVGRYVLPSFGPLYLAASVSVSVVLEWVNQIVGSDRKIFVKIFATVIFIGLMVLGVRNYILVVSEEKTNTADTNRIVDLIENSGDETTIVTDVSHIEWRIADVYFPGRPLEYTENVDDYTIKSQNAWLILNQPVDEVFMNFHKDDKIDFVCEGFFTDRYCYIYRYKQ